MRASIKKLDFLGDIKKVVLVVKPLRSGHPIPRPREQKQFSITITIVLWKWLGNGLKKILVKEDVKKIKKIKKS